MAVNLDDPGRAGPYKTVTMSLLTPGDFGLSTLTVVGPSDDGKMLADREKPYPLVMLAPAQFAAASQLQKYAERLASHGIFAVAFKRSDESNQEVYRTKVSDLITWLLAATDPNAQVLAGLLDGKRVGISGHELGGKISISVTAADPRIRALIAIDPVEIQTTGTSVSALGDIPTVSLPNGISIGLLGDTASNSGTDVCSPPDLNYQAMYTKAPSHVFAITFNGAALADFIDSYPFCRAGSTAPQGRTQSLAIKYVTAYFQWSLQGSSRARSYLLGADFMQDMSGGAVSLMSK
jgi:hypothetical protein